MEKLKHPVALDPGISTAHKIFRAVFVAAVTVASALLIHGIIVLASIRS